GKVSAAVYRTVQECLTNVFKHAPGARATVHVLGEGDMLRVEVRNDHAREPATPLPSGGHGLTGLAERARLLGGSFETDPNDDGGFTVRARYPIQAQPPHDDRPADTAADRASISESSTSLDTVAPGRRPD